MMALKLYNIKTYTYLCSRSGIMNLYCSYSSQKSLTDISSIIRSAMDYSSTKKILGDVYSLNVFIEVLPGSSLHSVVSPLMSYLENNASIFKDYLRVHVFFHISHKTPVSSSSLLIEVDQDVFDRYLSVVNDYNSLINKLSSIVALPSFSDKEDTSLIKASSFQLEKHLIPISLLILYKLRYYYYYRFFLT